MNNEILDVYIHILCMDKKIECIYYQMKTFFVNGRI